MPRIAHADHGACKKNTRNDAGTLVHSRKPHQGFDLEIFACLGLLALGFGIRIVGSSLL